MWLHSPLQKWFGLEFSKTGTEHQTAASTHIKYNDSSLFHSEKTKKKEKSKKKKRKKEIYCNRRKWGRKWLLKVEKTQMWLDTRRIYMYKRNEYRKVSEDSYFQVINVHFFIFTISIGIRFHSISFIFYTWYAINLMISTQP